MKKINAKDLLSSESEVLERISKEVIDSDVAEIISGHTSTTGHRSGSSHSSHSSAMREKINKK